MNDLDAARIVGLFAAAWPWAEWPEPTVSLWQSQLEPLNADIAAIAARRCVTELERPPALAHFLDRYQSERRADIPVYAALLEQLEPPDDRKAQAQHVMTMLEHARRPGEHWHGGPHPCPVCGGRRP